MRINKIAVDIDGTIASPYKLLLSYLGYEGDKEIIKDWDFFNRFGEKFWEAYEYAWTNYEKIPLTDPTVVATINKLSKYRVVDIVSARPEEYRDVTEAWLDMHGIKYRKLILLHPVYEKSALPGYDLYVDDNPNLVRAIYNKVVLYDQPWNRNVKAFARIRRMVELIYVIDFLESDIE